MGNQISERAVQDWEEVDSLNTPLSVEYASPVAVYLQFINAIARRDLDKVLECLSDNDGRELRDMRTEHNFDIFFDLWCSSYPSDISVVSYTISNETAELYVEGHDDNAAIAGHIDLRCVTGTWRITQETYTDTK